MGLIEYMRAAFWGVNNARSQIKPPKHRALLAFETGPAAAATYRLKHPRGLRQLQRYLRIEAGLRPLKFEVLGKRERKAAHKLAGAGR